MLCFAGLSLLSASTYQIMKMSQMLFVVGFSVLLLRRSYNLI